MDIEFLKIRPDFFENSTFISNGQEIRFFSPNPSSFDLFGLWFTLVGKRPLPSFIRRLPSKEMPSEMNSTSKHCPACKRRIPEAFASHAECVFCGIVFSKFTRLPVAPTTDVKTEPPVDLSLPLPATANEKADAIPDKPPLPHHVQQVIQHFNPSPSIPSLHCEACRKPAPAGAGIGDDCTFCGMIFTSAAAIPSDGELRQILASSPLPPVRAIGKSPSANASKLFGAVHWADKKAIWILRRLGLHPLPAWLELHHEAVVSWARGRMAFPRILVLVFMVYLGARYLFDVEYRSIFDGINLGIHEMGHLVFAIFPEFLTFLGGTLLQLAAPVICGVMLFRQSDYFGTSFCGSWLGANFYNVAIYQADAQSQLLPLVTVGGGVPIHDWHYLLDRLGLLQWDSQVAFITRVFGFLITWFSVVYGAWIVATLVKGSARVSPLV